jgi:hypothetical protein
MKQQSVKVRIWGFHADKKPRTGTVIAQTIDNVGSIIFFSRGFSVPVLCICTITRIGVRENILRNETAECIPVLYGRIPSPHQPGLEELLFRR